MKIKRTIAIATERDAALQALVAEYTRFKQAISETAYNGGNPLQAFALHQAVYHTVPNTLPAQMRCSAIRSVATAYSTARKNRKPATKAFAFKRDSALFLIEKRGRDASFIKGQLSISTIAGRKRMDYRIPEYAKADFANAVNYDSITATGDGKLRLCLTLEVPDPKGNTPVGIDLGATNALVASTEGDTLFVSGKRTKVANQRTRKTRQRLQKRLADRKAQRKDTRGARRLLKRLGRRQHNRNVTFCK